MLLSSADTFELFCKLLASLSKYCWSKEVKSATRHDIVRQYEHKKKGFANIMITTNNTYEIIREFEYDV